MAFTEECTVRDLIAKAGADAAMAEECVESAAVERAMLRSCAIVERFVESCASDDPDLITESCLQGLIEMLGGSGAAIEWRGLGEANDQEFRYRGMSESTAETLRASSFQFDALAPRERRIRSTDVEGDPELDGTFLKAVLSQVGIAHVTEIPIVATAARGGGTAWIVHPATHPPKASEKCMGAFFLERYASTIDRVLLARRSTGWNSQFRALLDGAMDGIICLDQAVHVVALNRSAAEMFGFSDQELLFRPVHGIIPSLESQLRSAAASRGKGAVLGSRLEVEGIARGDRRFPIEISVSESPAVGGYTLVMRDLTERKRIESQVWQADRLAAIGTLAAGLGHEMSNVQFPVRAHLNALADPSRRLDGRRRIRHIDEIRGSVSYLQQLADALHFLAMDPQADGDDLDGTFVDEWWGSTGALLRKALGRRATLSVDIACGLPRIAVPRHSLTRAVLNLLVNAAEAMASVRSADSAQVALRACLASDGAHVLIEVVDNGEGMTDEVRRRALDVFYTTKPRGLGTGLGLPLVRGVAERCGGRLEIESSPGVGTTVRVIVPVESGAAMAVETRRASIGLRDGRVATMVAGMLAAHGYEVEADGRADDADCWILDARDCVPADARRWVRTHAPEALVLIGRASDATARELSAFGATLVEDERDLEAIRRGIGRAVGMSAPEGVEHA